jgi:hypothetical protein
MNYNKICLLFLFIVLVAPSDVIEDFSKALFYRAVDYLTIDIPFNGGVGTLKYKLDLPKNWLNDDRYIRVPVNMTKINPQ